MAIAIIGITSVVWVPWLAAKSIEDVPPHVAAEMPKGCPAVSVSHGAYACNWRGTAASAPLTFALYVGAWAAGVVFIFATGLTGRGFPIKPPGSPGRLEG